MEVKLLHIANHMHHVLFEQKFMIGGFYNWHLVFQHPNNFVSYTESDVRRRILEGEFNVILFGISRPEMVANTINRVKKLAEVSNIDEKIIESNPQLQNEITEQILKTSVSNLLHIIKERKGKGDVKIAAHVDYAVQLWGTPILKEYFSPLALTKTLEDVDYIFSAEPVMGEWVHALTGRDVYFIPHPTNVDAIKQNFISTTKENIIRVLIHRYDNNWIAPFLVAEKSFDKLDSNSPLVSYIIMDGNQRFNTELRSMGCEWVEGGVSHPEWLKRLSQTKVIIDSYHQINTYGRSVVECAAVKTPIIGSDATYLQKVLFPELTTGPNEVLKQQEILNRLLKDSKFYKKVIDYAYNKVDEYGYDKSREKFTKMLTGELKPTWSKN